jgi:hypothetical protein
MKPINEVNQPQGLQEALYKYPSRACWQGQLHFAPCCQEMEEMCDNEKDQPEDRHTFFNCTCLLYPCQVESHSTEASRAEAQTLAQRLCCVLAPVTVKIFKSQQNLLASFYKCHVLMFCQKLYPGHLLKLVLKACWHDFGWSVKAVRPVAKRPKARLTVNLLVQPFKK